MPRGILSTFTTSDETSEGLERLGSVHEMLKDQTAALQELRERTQTLQTASTQVADFARQVKSIDGHLADAIAVGQRILGVRTGIGPLAQQIAEIKAKAVHQQHQLGLSKAAVDELITGAVTKSDARGYLVPVLALDRNPDCRMTSASRGSTPVSARCERSSAFL